MAPQVAGNPEFSLTNTYRILTTAALLNTPGSSEILGNESVASANLEDRFGTTSTGLQDSIIISLMAGKQPERSGEESVFARAGTPLNPLCERLETSVHTTLCSRSIQRTATKDSGTEALMLDVRVEGTDPFVGEYIVKSSLEREAFGPDGAAHNVSSTEELFQNEAVSAFSQILSWNDAAGATSANLSSSMRAVHLEQAILLEQRGCNESGLHIDLCPADGDTITTGIRFTSMSDVRVSSEAMVITKVQALPSCEQSVAAIGTGDVSDVSEDSDLHVCVFASDADGLPIRFTRADLEITWDNSSLPISWARGSSEYIAVVPPNRSPGEHEIVVALKRGWSQVLLAAGSCELVRLRVVVKQTDSIRRTVTIAVGAAVGASLIPAGIWVRRHRARLHTILLMVVSEWLLSIVGMGSEVVNIASQMIAAYRYLFVDEFSTLISGSYRTAIGFFSILALVLGLVFLAVRVYHIVEFTKTLKLRTRARSRSLASVAPEQVTKEHSLAHEYEWEASKVERSKTKNEMALLSILIRDVPLSAILCTLLIREQIGDRYVSSACPVLPCPTSRHLSRVCKHRPHGILVCRRRSRCSSRCSCLAAKLMLWWELLETTGEGKKSDSGCPCFDLAMPE
jgi:hypothetical protein